MLPSVGGLPGRTETFHFLCGGQHFFNQQPKLGVQLLLLMVGQALRSESRGGQTGEQKYGSRRDVTGIQQQFELQRADAAHSDRYSPE